MGPVVVGYRPTPEGEAALEQAVAEARLRDAVLLVVNSHWGGSELNTEASAEWEPTVEELEERLAGREVSCEVRQLVRGFEPAEDLMSLAETNDAELLVIGLRRRSPVGKLVLGSNAQRVLLDAPCPVLAVKPRE